MRRVLVTGGAGFIGSHVVRALVARGDEVRVLDNLSSGRRENLDGVGAEFVAGDVVDAAAVRGAMDGVTHVVHLAALVSVPLSIEDPGLSQAVNATGTLHVLQAAKEAGAVRVVLASSSAVYGDVAGPNHEEMPLRPLSPYGVDKMAGEGYASVFHRLHGLETVALRYFNVFGPRQDPASGYAAAVPRFVARLLDGLPPVIFGDGSQTRDFTFVGNVVRANLLALEVPAAAGGVFNIATGTSVTVRELAVLLAAIAGRPDLAPEYADPRPGDILHSSADVSLARERLGFSPEVGLRDGLEETLAWHRQTRWLPSASASDAPTAPATRPSSPERAR